MSGVDTVRAGSAINIVTNSHQEAKVAKTSDRSLPCNYLNFVCAARCELLSLDGKLLAEYRVILGKLLPIRLLSMKGKRDILLC